MARGYRPVLPSSIISERREDAVDFRNRLKDNTSLRLGVVIEVIEADDKRNQSKVAVEYRVQTMEDNNVAIYDNCLSIDPLGGIADYFRFKRRASDTANKVGEGRMKQQNGSLVLLLCLDGSSEQGVIIGAVAHPDKGEVLTKEKGHHLEGEFNGVNMEINKDGEFTVTYKSPTSNDGIPLKPSSGGSTIKMEKDGSIGLTAGTESIKLNKTSKKVSISALGNVESSSTLTTSISAKTNIELSAKAQLIMEATGSASLSSAKIDIEAKGPAKVKAAVLDIEVAGQFKIQSSSVLVQSPSIALGPAPTPALTISTIFYGTDIFGLPVVSFATGPFSSFVGIS